MFAFISNFNMVFSARDLRYADPQKLPPPGDLSNVNILYDYKLQVFLKCDNPTLEVYLLQEFISDFYEMELSKFKRKLKEKLDVHINRGFIIEDDHKLSLRDLTWYANKERKFAREMQKGRESGHWVKTLSVDVSMTTSQTEVVFDFVNRSIQSENLNLNDVIMLIFTAIQYSKFLVVLM